VTLRRTVLVTMVFAVLTLASCGGTTEAPTAARTGPAPISSGTTTPRPPPLTVDGEVTPAGWVPLDYGDAQISVPTSWTLLAFGCPVSAEGSVFLSGISPIEKVVCATKGNFVELGPGPADAAGPASLVNGIKVYESHGEWSVPSLGVQLTLVGSLSARVLHTLTHSPRSIALAPGPLAEAPPSWRRVSYGGISVAVPASWPVQKVSRWFIDCIPSDLTILPNTSVVLNGGATVIAMGCPVYSMFPVAAPKDGLVIEPGPYGPLQGDPTFGPCLHINGVIACPTTNFPNSVLDLAVHIPHHTRPVAVEIGLGGSGVVARTILDSITAS
jgi:hypothetical protein